MTAELTHTEATKPDTMILRFRDLSTAPGDTLRLHADKITEHGYVWWGWWAKAGERVPSQVFGALLQKARGDDGLPLWLFDSGREQLHAATLSDIVWDHAFEPIVAPEDATATPAYYNQGGQARYLAWFKLTAIDLGPETDLSAILDQHSYVQVDEFFTHRSSRFSAFYGKRIYSLAELRQQERTIWFIRRAKPADPRHEIMLLDARTASPSHFPEQFQQSPSLNLLWLSDVHFSVDGHHAFPTAPTTTAKPLGDRVEQACRRHGIENLGGIILSGDLAWRAEADEFAQAHALLRRLQTWSGVENYQIVVCPGNHDVKFSDQPQERDVPVGPAPGAATAGYGDFYSELFYLAPNQWLSCGRRFLLGNAVPVEIVSLNSSLLWQSPGLFQGQGFVGEDQLENAAVAMGWSTGVTGPRPLRIAVVHHHLLPVIFREEPVAGRSYSTVLDAEALVRWLINHEVRVVLHGHMHTPFYTVLERPLRFGEEGSHRIHVFGMGSSGVESGHLGEVPENMFGVLRFTGKALTVNYITVHPTNEPRVLQTIPIPL